MARRALPRIVPLPLIPALVLASAAACAPLPSQLSAPTVPVLLGENEFARVNGSWEGGLESESDGRVVGTNTVRLTMKDGLGTFSLGTGERWDTVAQIRDGKLLLGFEFGTRAFTLGQGGGQLFLKTSYEARWQGQPRKHTVILKRTSTP
jgi:hypothetical protein